MNTPKDLYPVTDAGKHIHLLKPMMLSPFTRQIVRKIRQEYKDPITGRKALSSDAEVIAFALEYVYDKMRKSR